MSQHKNRISIQVGLSGYSFKVYGGPSEVESSGWMSADRVFTTNQFQKRYDSIDISVFTPKAALVPSQFFDPQKARDILSDVVKLSQEDIVEFISVSHHAAVLVFSNVIGETLSKVISETVLHPDGTKARLLPELYFMLEQMPLITGYNKILASYMDGVLYLVIAQGKTLLLCNSYQAPDFTTAEYFIFLAMKKLQLNIEASSIVFRTPLTEEDELSLYRYFKSVDQI